MRRGEGVLPRQDLAKLHKDGDISAPSLSEEQLQPASLDLRLDDSAICVSSSFIPGETESIYETAKRLKTGQLKLSDSETTVLKVGKTYIIPLVEDVELKQRFHGVINPKSTTGRSDLLTLTLVDGVPVLDTVLPGQRRKMFAEVTPLSFDIGVRAGLVLNQLRVMRGNSQLNDASLDMEYQYLGTTLLQNYFGMDIPHKNASIKDSGIEISYDLQSPIVAYEAREDVKQVLDLSAPRGTHLKDLEKFWRIIERPANGELNLRKDKFYLLATRERVRLPPHICGYVDAYDPTTSEGRNQSAGYLDDGFGYGRRGEIPSSQITLEKRVHYKQFRITDGQKVGKVRYHWLLAIPVDNKGRVAVYGVGIYAGKSNYQRQLNGPMLGKQFLSPN